MRCKYAGISYHIDELFKMSLSLIAESLGSSGGSSHSVHLPEWNGLDSPKVGQSSAP